jgi:hypothetical protein
MVFFSFGYARMFATLEKFLIHEGQSQPPAQVVSLYYDRMLQLSRINVSLGIIAILLTAALR